MKIEGAQQGDVIVVRLIGTFNPMSLNLFEVFGPEVTGQKFVVDLSGVVPHEHPMFWFSLGAWLKRNNDGFVHLETRMVLCGVPEPLTQWVFPIICSETVEEAIASFKK